MQLRSSLPLSLLTHPSPSGKCRIVVLIGLPGSGKSTLAGQLQAQTEGMLLVSTDAIRQHLFGHESVQGPWLLIWAEIQRQIQHGYRQVVQGLAYTVCYDATNAVRRDRRRFIALAQAIGFTQVVGLWLDTPLAVCLERNQQRERQVPPEIITRMHHSLTHAPPSLADPLDWLVRCPYPPSGAAEAEVRLSTGISLLSRVKTSPR